MILRWKKLFAVAGVLMAAALMLRAQDPQEPVIRVGTSLVLVEATVKNRAGQPMKEMKQEDFWLFEDGKQQKVEHFSVDQIPLAVAMVVDLSGSIQPFLNPLRYASTTALKALKAEDEVALFTFTDQPELRVELTRDKSKIADQIRFFRAGGGTNINDALYDAARYLREERPAARRVIILVSDNVSTGGARVSGGRVEEEALAADAAVYSLKVPGENPVGAKIVGKLSFESHVNIRKLTEATGGEIFDMQKQGSLYVAFQTLIERLKTRYTLGFYANGERTAGFHALDIKLHPVFGRKGSDYTVVSKRGYYVPRK